MQKRTHVLFALMLAWALGVPAGVQADPLSFHVTLDTSPLAGAYSIYFGLAGGNGATNDLNISNIVLGGGSITGSPVYVGSANGDLATTITLASDMSVNEFTQEFQPGGSLQFDVLLPTLNVNVPVPDRFIFGLLDGNGDFVATDDPLAGVALAGLDLSDGSLLPTNVETYRYTVNGVDYAAQVSPIGVSAVPEPGALALGGGVALCGAASMLRRRQRLQSGSH